MIAGAARRESPWRYQDRLPEAAASARPSGSLTSSSSFLRIGDLIDPALVPSALERRRQPQREDFVGESEGDDASAHREDVRVVVLAGEPRCIEIVAERRADARHLVRGN